MGARIALSAAAAALWLVTAASGQARPLRLFLSTIGLSDAANSQSAALNPSAALDEDLFVSAGVSDTLRLYVWAQITPPGPGIVTYNGVSLRVQLRDSLFGSATIAGSQFWNFSGSGSSRWQNVNTTAISPTEIQFSGVCISSGWGVTNALGTGVGDVQRIRFAPDGVTRIDCTLLGYVELSTGGAPAAYEVALAVGSQGIVRQGAPIERIYLGWHDEHAAPLGSAFGAASPISEAFVYHAGPPCDFQNPPPDDQDCDSQPDGVDLCPTVFEVFDMDDDGRFNVCDVCPHGIGGSCTAPRGDLDCSGEIDFFDVDPFLLAYFNVTAYRAQFHACDEALADMDGNAAVDAFDIDPFLACLLGCP